MTTRVSSFLGKGWFAIALLFAASTAGAQLPGFGGSAKHVTAELISEQSAIAPGKSFRVAVKLEIDEHWHSYGQVVPEGSFGKPTKIGWSLPAGWKAEYLPWPPTSKVPSTKGTTTEGYDSVVYLPVLLTPPGNLVPGATVKLEAQMDMVVCKEDTCMPVFD